MKSLTTQNMISLEAGSWWDLVDSACAGYALVVGLTYGAVIANPVGGAIGAGCAIRGAYVVLDSIK